MVLADFIKVLSTNPIKEISRRLKTAFPRNTARRLNEDLEVTPKFWNNDSQGSLRLVKPNRSVILKGIGVKSSIKRNQKCNSSFLGLNSSQEEARSSNSSIRTSHKISVPCVTTSSSRNTSLLKAKPVAPINQRYRKISTNKSSTSFKLFQTSSTDSFTPSEIFQSSTFESLQAEYTNAKCTNSFDAGCYRSMKERVLRSPYVYSQRV